jgi:hypothetical protein
MTALKKWRTCASQLFLTKQIHNRVENERLINSQILKDFSDSKTTGIVKEGNVIKSGIGDLVVEVFYLAEEEIICASLGFELVKEFVFNDFCS